MKESDILKLQKKLNKEALWKQSEYISKKQALKERRRGDGNQLGRSFWAIIFHCFHRNQAALRRYANSDSIAKIEKMIRKETNIQDVLYRKELIDAVNENIRNISLVLLALAVVLTFISFALINNTIRLAIYSKRFLIHTMEAGGSQLVVYPASFPEEERVERCGGGFAGRCHDGSGLLGGDLRARAGAGHHPG